MLNSDMDSAQSNTANQNNSTSIFTPTPQMIKEYVEKLRSQNTDESKEVAALIEEDMKTNQQLTENEKKLSNILQLLKERKVEDELLEVFTNAIITTLYQQTISRLVLSMGPETRAYWDEINDQNPSIFQIFALLNFYCQSTFGSDLDVYMDEVLGSIIDDYIESIKEDLEFSEAITKKTPAELKAIKKLLKEYKLDEAMIILFSEAT